MLLNLFSNAREAILAGPAGHGQIVVQLDRVGDQARLTVADNGGGIAESALPRLFEPYFSTKPGGTGIGLYMSKRIIEHSMSGWLSARNVATGAELTVLTPLAGKPSL